MSLDIPAYLETRRKFLANRAAFPVEELEKYAGQWVAWSPDGSRIAASAASPELLDGLLFANGLDPALCVVEGIPAADATIGEADGSGA
ncbi:MAG: hypothetical protein L0Y72_19460 [Gemmataceae bacterium]|nr:hypothetical protein [Gemmataceae bacterium]MCI0741214.1 hypothetical protein [Gemmataceae bacterium]